MSDNEGDWGRTELDAEERADAEINLDDPTAGDNEPWSPPDRQPRAGEFLGYGEDETIDQRIAQEEPEVGTAYGAPDPRGEAYDTGEDDEDRIGGDDPDSIPADRDFLGEEAPEALPENLEVLGANGDEVLTETSPEAEAMHYTEE